jgi:hypothetical protein
MITIWSGECGRGLRVALATAVLLLLVSGPAKAQSSDDPNPGALTFTGGLDFPTIYFFRGIRQETDANLTMWPYGDLGIALFSGDGGLKSVGVNVGVWNSLHTGSSGSDRVHYEMDFYSTLALGFGGGVSVGTTYTAYTSPNGLFDTVNELSFRVSKAHMLAPYGLIAFELDDEGQADLGSNKGTYLELGVAPSWPLVADGPTLAIPVKLGLSLKDYYEGPDGDNTFGFFDVGGLITVPLKGVPSRFGAWNIHGGLNFLFLGDGAAQFNVNQDGEQKDNKVIGLFGIGVTYERRETQSVRSAIRARSVRPQPDL